MGAFTTFTAGYDISVAIRKQRFSSESKPILHIGSKHTRDRCNCSCCSPHFIWKLESADTSWISETESPPEDVKTAYQRDTRIA